MKTPMTRNSKPSFLRNGRAATTILASLSYVLIQFTAPDGSVIWVNPDQVSIVEGKSCGCLDPVVHSCLIGPGGRFCIAEDIGDAMRKMTGTTFDAKPDH